MISDLQYRLLDAIKSLDDAIQKHAFETTCNISGLVELLDFLPFVF